MVMENHDSRTCFIFAPVGVDIQPLRDELAARGVTPLDQTDLLALPFERAPLVSAVANADFVCGVIAAGSDDANILVELGMAIGTERPLLVFVAPNAELPTVLRSRLYVYASPSDREAVRFVLDVFLRHAGQNGREPEATAPDVHAPELRSVPNGGAQQALLDRLDAWESQGSPPDEQELVALLASLFDGAGFVTSVAFGDWGPYAPRADLAVWVDELETVLPGPLLISVSAQPGTFGWRLRRFRDRLAELRSPLGLAVLWEQNGSERPPDERRSPFVVEMDVRELVEAVERGDFARAVLSRRNVAVPSVA